MQRVKSRSVGDKILPLFKRLINQSFPGVGQSVIFCKLTIDLAIISWQKKVSLGVDESRSVPWCGNRLLLVLCAWFTRDKYANVQKNLKSLSKSD